MAQYAINEQYSVGIQMKMFSANFNSDTTAAADYVIAWSNGHGAHVLAARSAYEKIAARSAYEKIVESVNLSCMRPN